MATYLPTEAQNGAQTIDNAYEEFSKVILDKKLVTASNFETFSNGYIKWLTFVIPSKKSKELNKLNATMSQGDKDVYNSLIKNAGTKDENQIQIGYGENNSKSILFGTRKKNNYNVQVLRANETPDMRYVYALVWTNCNDSIFGSTYKIYGKAPQETTNDKQESSIPTYIAPKSSADFIQQFMNLSTIITTNTYEIKELKKQKNTPAQTSIKKRIAITTNAANRIMRLCKEHNNLINSKDSQRIISMIMKLKSRCTDELMLIDDLLTISQMALR